MTNPVDRQLLVGLEIGTTKIAALVGESVSDNVINIIAEGYCLSKGIEQGYLNDLESVVKCIHYVIDEAEKMANCQISSVHLAVSGKHISCLNEIGMVAISDDTVTQEDIEDVIHAAKTVRIHDEYYILHVIPQDYIVDYQKGIKNPIGLSGVRMQAKVHLITCHKNTVKNIVKAIEHCGLTVDQIVFSGLAASYAVINANDKELGVCVIDMGGGTMDIAIYTNGSLRYTKTIPYAGNIVTKDIAYAFNISYVDAEKIKIRYGCAFATTDAEKEQHIEIPCIGEQPIKNIKRQMLIDVIEARYIELFNLVNNEILQIQEQLRSQGVKHRLNAGIILTGGASQIENIIPCAQQIFCTKVRIGKPLNISGLVDCAQKPYYSTIVGLLHYIKDLYLSNDTNTNKHNIVISWFKRLINWLKKEF